MQIQHRPFLLIILDGWGHRENTSFNAIHSAKKPTWDKLWKHCPHLLLSGSGEAVGLPEGQMGNSEVGHLTIGAGRLVYQDFTRVGKSITDGTFFTNPALVNAIKKAVNQKRAVHILGLLSPGGVHSHEEHIHAMVELAAKQGTSQLFVHAFLDGRDTPPQSALQSIDALENKLHSLNCGKIASLIGRFYAMDRDKRWERIKTAYDLLTQGIAVCHTTSAKEGLAQAYARGETDEFVQATAVHDKDKPPITLNEGDVVVFMNFRTDRTRELTHALIDEHFPYFERAVKPSFTDFVTLTDYEATLKTSIAFPTLSLNNILGETLSAKGLHQLRIAETEKYAHVTFFFNGGIEQPFQNEERILIPSPRVTTYDHCPEMSAFPMTDQLVAAIQSKKYDFIVCNFANPDMVGHTGNFMATLKAIETVDTCLSRIIDALKAVGGEAIITADHGNAECLYDEEHQQPHTAHTTDPVPFIFIGRQAKCIVSTGTLADIAPTILYCMGIPTPQEMTGNVLLHLGK